MLFQEANTVFVFPARNINSDVRIVRPIAVQLPAHRTVSVSDRQMMHPIGFESSIRKYFGMVQSKSHFICEKSLSLIYGSVNAVCI